MILKNVFFMFLFLALFSCSNKPNVAQKLKFDISEISETTKNIEDPFLLFKTYQQLAANGNSEAMVELSSGYIYDENLRAFDAKKAMRWLSKAAKQGNPHASFELAEIYAEGLSDAQGNLKVSGNKETSLMWVYIGQHQVKQLEKLKLQVNEVDVKKISSMGIRRAKKRAEDWLDEYSS